MKDELLKILPWALLLACMVYGLRNNKYFHLGDDVQAIQRGQFLLVFMAIGLVVLVALMVMKLLNA